mmetsp:Transcript_30195/g.99929  ORF Transcript_30195/g.99929 Transcript_30195/m.99929 type:complete len:221 (+) Transcript_30195:1518-2180(+)
MRRVGGGNLAGGHTHPAGRRELRLAIAADVHVKGDVVPQRELTVLHDPRMDEDITAELPLNSVGRDKAHADRAQARDVARVLAKLRLQALLEPAGHSPQRSSCLRSVLLVELDLKAHHLAWRQARRICHGVKDKDVLLEASCGAVNEAIAFGKIHRLDSADVDLTSPQRRRSLRVSEVRALIGGASSPKGRCHLQVALGARAHVKSDDIAHIQPLRLHQR